MQLPDVGEYQTRHVPMAAAVGGPGGGPFDGRAEEHAGGSSRELDLAGPSGRLFQCATTRERLLPGGRERTAIPSEVRVRTAEPGSSVMMLEYRHGHLAVSCGPSSRTATTRLGPIRRT